MKTTFLTSLIPCTLFVCARAVGLTPDEQADAFHQRGVAAEQRGDLMAAENCYALALRVSASHPAALASMAEFERSRPARLTPSASHTFEGDRLEAMNDGREPFSSRESSIPRFTWYPKKASLEWVQYDFDKPQVVDACSVYWFNDNGGVRLPEFWKVLYLDESGIWMPVDGEPPAPAENEWNTCSSAV